MSTGCWIRKNLFPTILVSYPTPHVENRLLSIRSNGQVLSTCPKYKFVFKGIVHPKLKMLSSITHLHVVPNLYKFLSDVKHKEYILKAADNQTVVGPH